VNNCSTCKHWKEPSNGYFGFPDHYGKCILAESDSGKPAYPESLALAMDAELHSAGLYCKPTFGCVQWGGAK